MRITVDVPDELAEQLSTEAADLGLTLADYALRVLGTNRTEVKRPKTGAEVVAYWERMGVIGSRPDITDSQAHARALREKAQRRTLE